MKLDTATALSEPQGGFYIEGIGYNVVQDLKMLMKLITITPLSKTPIIRFSGKSVILSQNIQNKINKYWEELLSSGKTYTRGAVFTVIDKRLSDTHIELLVDKTDYAHYVYCQNIDQLGEYGVHIIHTAALVETSDGKLVLGKMGKQTSRAGIYQLCGGGIDADDIHGDIFDFEHNIVKELHEELGIDAHDTSRVRNFELAYLKEGGPTDKITVIYKVILSETSNEFLGQYSRFVSNLQKEGNQPEFAEIVILNKDKQVITNFVNREEITLDEYMKPLFEYLANDLT